MLFLRRQAHFCVRCGRGRRSGCGLAVEAQQPSKRDAVSVKINEEAWASLYQTRSTPFDPPKLKEGSKGKGKVAVKLINHYGDEVMQVYEV